MPNVCKIRIHFILEQLKYQRCPPPDALDYTEKWLEDTVRCLRDEAEADRSSAASSDPPTLLSLNVHNHAYLRLLKWDHASDPFPEVDAVISKAILYVFVISSVTYDSLWFATVISVLLSLSVDRVDGSGPLPGDAAGG